MGPLYNKAEANNHWFVIYHLHYKEKLGMTKSIHQLFLFWLPLKLLSLPSTLSNYCG